MRFLYELDIIGHKPEIKLGNNSTYKTFIGSCLSIFIFFITFYSSKEIFKQYIDKTFPKESINYINNMDKINFDLSNLPILIQYLYFDPKEKKYFEIDINKVNQSSFTFPFLEVNELHDSKVTKITKKVVSKCNRTYINAYIQMLNATNSSQFNLEKEFFESFIEKSKTSFCFNQTKEDIELFHIKTDSNLKKRYLILLFQSSLISDMKSYSNNTFILPFVCLRFPKYYFSVSEKNKQYTKDLVFELFPITTKAEIHFYDIFFNSFDIISDYSEFFIENQQEKTFYSLENISFRGSVDSGFFDNLNITYNSLNLVLNMSKMKRIFQYKYIGITDIISDIGGSFEIYFILISFIHKVLSQFHYKSFLINSIFAFHVNKESNFEENVKRLNTVKSAATFSERRKGRWNSSVPLETKKELVDDIVKTYIHSKEKVFISAKDVLYTSFRKIFNMQTVKNKIISKCVRILSIQYEYSNIIRLLLEDYIQKELILDESLQKFMHFPSINLSNEKYSLGLLSKVIKKREEIQFSDVKLLIDKNINQKKYMRLFEFFMEK